MNAVRAHTKRNGNNKTRLFRRHGYDPRLHEMKGIFYAGPNLKRRNLKDVDNVDIAPTVAELLGIDPPKDSQGKKIRTGDK